MSESAIRLHHATVVYGVSKALKDISLSIPSGQIVGVLGPSGAGKTTLLRIVVGRLRLSSGEASVLGYPAGHRKLRGRIGYMTQGTSVYPDLTVEQNLRYFATILGVGLSSLPSYLAEVDLARQTKQLAGTLSGGQKSRLSLAIALMGDPELLVLDEPTVGVDPVLRRQLWGIFHRQATKGTTIIVSSHVMDEAAHCDDLLLVRHGRILAHDSPANLCAHTHTTTVEEAFLKLVEMHQ
jgi:ABC-2 type transport system ATP-binding protein